MRSLTVRRAGSGSGHPLQPGLASLLCMTEWLPPTLPRPHSLALAFVPALPLACLPFPSPEQRWSCGLPPVDPTALASGILLSSLGAEAALLRLAALGLRSGPGANES